MPMKSLFPDLEIPQTDILTYLFPPSANTSDKPLWIDAANPSIYLTLKSALPWIKRLAVGLQRLDLRPGDVAMIFTPNATGLPKSRLFLFDADEAESISGLQDWRRMIGTEAESQSWQWAPLDAESSQRCLATVNYSSGTTGLPKGVCISHYNLIANVEQHIFIRDHKKPYESEPRNRPKERWVGFLPLYHAYGQLYSFLMAPKLGVPVYIMRKFEYEAFLNVIQTYKITHLQAIPPILVMLSKRPETAKYNLSSLTDILCGAAPMRKELQNDVMGRFHLQINQGWGITEVTCGGMNMPRGIKDDTGSVGMLHSNNECKLVDDDRHEVGPGERGELYIRGPNICLGYWRNELATKDSIDKDGWLKTGDVAVFDNRGWFWIVDRKKELIKVRGLQVAPAELEAALIEHDDVADAAVVGITLGDDEWPWAYIVLKEHSKHKQKEKTIQAWMRGRLARHKWLEGGVVFVDEVPRLASGKIKRKVMKEWAKRDAEAIDGRAKASL